MLGALVLFDLRCFVNCDIRRSIYRNQRMVGATKCCGVEVFLRGCSFWERWVIVSVFEQKLLDESD
jgi:hypothetical protein